MPRFLKHLFFRIVLLAGVLLLSTAAQAQEKPRQLFAKFITEEIKLDGQLDEAAWQNAEVAEDFWQNFPSDSTDAKYDTKIKVVYTESTLYFAIRAESSGDDFVVSTLKRDFSGRSNDNVTVLLDTYSDGTNAFGFGVSPYGVQREVLVSGGGIERGDWNFTWDVKWKSKSTMHDDHFIVEIAIPFTSIKFQEGSKKWRFRGYRFNYQDNERSTWVRVPQNMILINLAFMGELIFEKPLGRSRTPLTLIPYVNALTQKDFVGNESDNTIGIGGDAKIAIGNNLNLDLTVNPDFSNIEVDDIITNLTRFEVSLPERRQFFIDNSDLFNTFGNRRDNRPFFSRRIGLATDTAGNTIQNDILGGLRLSGKLNENWRLGLLNIQTAADTANQIASNNNSMLVLQRKLFSRSNVGMFLINRETFDDYDFMEEADRYNRVAGLEYTVASSDNVWTGKFYAHKSLNPDDKDGNISAQAYLIRQTKKWRLASRHTYIDAGYQSDLGFVPRNDAYKPAGSISRFFYPGNKILNRHDLRILGSVFFRPTLDYQRTDHTYQAIWNFYFTNQSDVELKANNRYIFLTDEFDPTSTDGGIPLPSDIGYNFMEWSGKFNTNRSKNFIIEGNSTIGSFFTGQRYSFGGELFYRLPPRVSFSLAANYDRIRLPDPHPDADLWLLSPRFEFTFTKSLFWTTIFQYSNQQDNLGVNSRLQWRFAPLSDLYLVYNDNYYVNQFEPKFRSLNLKVTYWLNI